MNKFTTYGKWLLAPAIIVAAVLLLLRSPRNRHQLDDLDAQVYELCRCGNFSAACRLLEQAIAQLPAEQSYRLRYSLIQIYLRQKRYESAQYHLQICLRQAGPAAPLQIIQAQIWYASGRRSDAIRALAATHCSGTGLYCRKIRID